LRARIYMEPRILDGAMGSMLIARGLAPGEGTAGWNLTHPEEVRAVHRAYFEAGADIVHANTFAANAEQLSSRGLGAKHREINWAAVEIARSVCPACGFVAGDIGPTGCSTGLNGPEELERWERVFHQQASVLVEAGCDLISIETMYDLKEALCALRGAIKAGELPVMVSVTFNKTPRGFFTAMGDAPAEAVRKLTDAGASAVGVNCTLGSRDMRDLLAEIHAVSEVPVYAQPNAGQPRLVSGATVYEESPGEFAENTARMLTMGAWAVGGCCGTTDEHISELVRRARGSLEGDR